MLRFGETSVDVRMAFPPGLWSFLKFLLETHHERRGAGIIPNR